MKPIQPNLKSFPLINNRRFVYGWYQKFTWLEFSEKENKCYCFPCRLFDPFSNIKNGINIDKNTLEKIKKHEITVIHKTSNVKI